MEMAMTAMACASMMAHAAYGQTASEIDELCRNARYAEGEISTMIDSSTEAIQVCRDNLLIRKALMDDATWRNINRPICFARHTETSMRVGDTFCGTNVEILVGLAIDLMEEWSALVGRRIVDAC